MDIISRINWIDILVVIICARVSYVAFKDGLSHEIFPLIGTACTLIFTLHYYRNLSFFMGNNVANLPVEISNFTAFLILTLFFGMVFKILRSILEKLIKVTWHPVLDKFGGLAFGVVRSGIIVCIILTIIALAPVPYLQHSIRDKSLVGMRFLKIGPVIYSKVYKYLPASDAGVKSLPSQKKI